MRHEDPVPCPYCNSTDTDAEFAHNGIGYQQVSPYHCINCNSYQICDNKDESSSKERKTGWHEPLIWWDHPTS